MDIKNQNTTFTRHKSLLTLLALYNIVATIRIGVRKTKQEWDRIESIIESRNKGKKLIVRGKGINQFINNEVNRIFRQIDLPNCHDVKVAHVKKDFSINTSDANAKKIVCLANSLGIDPATLIVKMIVDPHLFLEITAS